jgi:putative polyketide hydroxylase
MQSQRVPVLIVGGGLAGLSAAAFLAWRGVASLVVERHPDLLIHPRARGFNPRTVELYRRVGLEPEILAACNYAGDFRKVILLRAETLAAKDYQLIEQPAEEQFRDASPCNFAGIDQDRLEVLLRDRARALGAEVRFATEMMSFEHDATGVSALIRDLRSGDECLVRADYLIAADGCRSPIREHLGIPVRGPGPLWQALTVLFEADLEPALRGRQVFMAYLNSPRPATVLMPHDGRGRWVFATGLAPRGEALSDFSDERCITLIRQAVGLTDVDVRIVPQIPGTELKVLCFPISAQIAERYRAGRVFLVGDAAHAMPPTGGFGANVGIQDAYDLAWKLAFVLQDQASARLLETYQAERLPVAEFTLGQALARTHDRMRSGTAPDGPPLADYAAVVFGYQYRSTAIPGAVDEETTALTSRELRAQPGTRAPHATVTAARRARSILDLFGSDFTLVVGRDGASWRRAAGAVAARLQLPLTLLQLDSELEDASGQLQERYRLGTEAAVLIRPDGFVAWRCEHANADSERAFERVLERILGKESSARTSLAPSGLVH